MPSGYIISYATVIQCWLPEASTTERGLVAGSNKNYTSKLKVKSRSGVDSTGPRKLVNKSTKGIFPPKRFLKIKNTN